MCPESIKRGARQTSELQTLESEAQQVLDKLLAHKLVPFALSVGKITKGMGEYTIHFYDSRMRTARVPLTDGHSWAEMVRSAVLERVSKLSGPLHRQ